MSRAGPTYDLRAIQECVGFGQYQVTGSTLTGLGELGLDRDDLESAILALTEAEFHKTMPSEVMTGLWQDVYTPVYCGRHLYIKLQVVQRSGDAALAIVVSFKRN